MEFEGARLWLVRHGETDWNAVGRVQGHTPTELNERGRGQARELGRMLKGRSFAAVWSSDLPRAYQTAELLAEAAGFQPRLAVEKTERLRERSFGKYEGSTMQEMQEVRKSLGLVVTKDLADWTGMPGVESNEVLWERIDGVMREISGKYAGERGGDVIVVTHGGVIARVVYRVLGIPEGTPRHFPLSNGIVAVVQSRQEVWHLLSLMDLSLAVGAGDLRKDTSLSR